MECVTLLHCSLLDSEARKGEALRNLHLKPVFWREYRVRSTNGGGKKDGTALPPHPLQSSLHPHLMSLTLVFSTQLEGHLYHLPGHLRKPGKGCGVHKVASYPFTSSVLEVALEPTMLHALTETGLESYTLKSGYSTVREAEKLDGRTNACPPNGGGRRHYHSGDEDDDDNPVCLVGLRPFLGAARLQVTQSHLVLLCRPDEAADDGDAAKDQQDWTMYSLALPTPTDVNRDMLQLASLNRASSPQGYFQLLCEAHMVLRMSLRQLSWQQAVGSNGAKEKYAQTKEKYLETCHLLGIYYALSKDSSKWPLAVPYFRMSGKPAVACLHSCLEEHFRAAGRSSQSTTAGLPPGVVSYMEEIVLRPAVPSENVLEAGLADTVIDLLGRHSVPTLASLVLKSRGLREFKTRKTRKLLKDACAEEEEEEEERTELILALCLQSLDEEESREESRRLLRRVSQPAQVALASILIENHWFLFDGGRLQSSKSQVTGFSELAELLQECIPETFAEVSSIEN